jgi:putative transcriptional regulator
MIESKLNKGNLLISKPSILNDTSFNRSVILLTEHNTEGSVGFIINKPSIFTINDLIPDLDSDHVVYDGGPVSVENLYFIHRVPELIPNSIAIKDGVFWAGDFEIVTNLLNEKKVSKNDIRFFLGYTGWSEKQLDDEMKSDSWILKKNNYENILNVEANTFWKNEILKIGGEYQLWANAPKNPSLN